MPKVSDRRLRLGWMANIAIVIVLMFGVVGVLRIDATVVALRRVCSSALYHYSLLLAKLQAIYHRARRCFVAQQREIRYL